MTTTATHTGRETMNATEIAMKHGIESQDVRQVMSKPMNCGIIRVAIAKVKRTYHIYDDSENSEGYHCVVGEKKMREVLASITRESRKTATLA